MSGSDPDCAGQLCTVWISEDCQRESGGGRARRGGALAIIRAEERDGIDYRGMDKTQS